MGDKRPAKKHKRDSSTTNFNDPRFNDQLFHKIPLHRDILGKVADFSSTREQANLRIALGQVGLPPIHNSACTVPVVKLLDKWFRTPGIYYKAGMQPTEYEQKNMDPLKDNMVHFRPTLNAIDLAFIFTIRCGVSYENHRVAAFRFRRNEETEAVYIQLILTENILGEITLPIGDEADKEWSFDEFSVFICNTLCKKCKNVNVIMRFNCNAWPDVPPEEKGHESFAPIQNNWKYNLPGRSVPYFWHAGHNLAIMLKPNEDPPSGRGKDGRTVLTERRTYHYTEVMQDFPNFGRVYKKIT